MKRKKARGAKKVKPDSWKGARVQSSRLGSIREHGKHIKGRMAFRSM